MTHADVEHAELLVAGPGPGDPRDLTDRRIAALHGMIADGPGSPGRGRGGDPAPVPVRQWAGARVWTAGAGSDEVVALRGDRFASVQFHLESVLSPDGVTLLADLVAALLDG